MPRQTNIKPRRGTAAQWALQNPVLDAGEMGLETDTMKFKFGDGTTTWNSLPYASSGPGEPAITPGLTTQFWRGDKTWQVIENPVRSFSELQAAVAVGGTIRIDNNYPITITSTINITKPCHIIGGDLNLPNDSPYGVFYITSSNVTLDNVRITGGGTASGYWVNARFVLAEGTSTAKLSNIKVTGCNFKGCQSENVRLLWTEHCSVTNNVMDDFRYSGVMVLSGTDITVMGNTITNSPLISPVLNVYGIAASDLDNTDEARCRNVVIVGNTVRNIEWEGIDTHGGYNLIISDNIVTGCPRGIALVVGNSSRLTVSVNNIVNGNVVIRDGALYQGVEREGISLYGLTTNKAEATITNNIIREYTLNPLYLDFTTTEHKKTIALGNTHPYKKWAGLVMNNTAAWTANTLYDPEYMVDGTTVTLRGMVISQSGSTANSRIGTIPAEFAPPRTTYVTASLGSNTSAGSGLVTVLSNGEIWMYYRRGTDGYSYQIDGKFERAMTIT